MAITTKSIPIHGGRTYPQSFTPKDLMDYARFVHSHSRIVLLKDYARGDRALDTVCIRHDVDHSATHAVEFADWEAKRKIKASYFLLPTAPYYESDAEEAARAIQDLGHEVGIHNNAYTAAKGNPDKAIELLREWVAEMRSWGITVVGCSDHGGGSPNNNLLWQEGKTETGVGAGRKPGAAGLKYEAYLLHRTGTHYISDSHGKWNGPLEKRADRPTHLLVHPEHWEVP